MGHVDHYRFEQPATWTGERPGRAHNARRWLVVVIVLGFVMVHCMYSGSELPNGLGVSFEDAPHLENPAMIWNKVI